MNHREECVKEFHDAFGVEVDKPATLPLIELRIKLIDEESLELIQALDMIRHRLFHGQVPSKGDWANVLDGMADLQYVLSGTAIAVHELRNFDEVFDRVHASNMSKLGKDGKPIYRTDGKVLKGPGYKLPYLDDLID